LLVSNKIYAIVFFTIDGTEMKIIKTKVFSRWACKNQVNDEMLCNATEEILAGSFEANYGGGIIKKRIATKARGKSSSIRTMVALKKGTHCFFIYGFEKNKKSNISQHEEKAIKVVAKALFSYSAQQLDQFIAEGALIEVDHEQKSSD